MLECLTSDILIDSRGAGGNIVKKFRGLDPMAGREKSCP